MEQTKENNYTIKGTQKDFIGIYENILSKEKCQEIIKRMQYHMECNPSEVKKGKDQFPNGDVGRKDYQIFADRFYSDISQEINMALNACVNLYADEFFTLKNIKELKSETIKLQMTPPRGGYHFWHCEQSSLGTSHRVLAWTIYLNDIPDGEGETEFLWQGVKVKPRAGTISIFPATFTHTHRGNPVYSCDKYIATGWYTFNE
jgi:hypothetical protein